MPGNAIEEINGLENGSGVDQLNLGLATNPFDNEIDSSDEEDLRNTIGNVPLKWYDDYDHIGYDLNGKKIEKKSLRKKDDLDEFIDKMEDPNYWRTVIDQQTGEPIVLTDQDIDLIKRLSSAKYPSDDVEEFETSNFFTRDEMKMPLSGRPEHKRSFVPSNWERLRVGQLVHAIKSGLIQPKRPREDEFKPKFYDIWGPETDEQKLKRHLHSLPAPKLPLPDHRESYNPPAEYLFDEKELEKWQNSESHERRINFVPKKYPSLRLVPGYGEYIQEKFTRCLDLYLCPRQRKMKVDVDPQDLLPKLPKPKDLQPFPNQLSIMFNGHKNIVRSISIHPSGQWLISGSDDKTVRFWEVSTGRCLKTIKFEDKISLVLWIPSQTHMICSIISDKSLILINPKLGDKLISSSTDSLLKDYHLKYQEQTEITNSCDWTFFSETTNNDSYKKGLRIQLNHEKSLKHSAWHPKGDYLATVIDDKNSNNSIHMHQLSKQKSVRPFAGMKGIVQQVVFHPYKPILFVAVGFIYRKIA